MADNTSIPIIVQGNSFSLAIPLQIYVIDDNEMVLEDYTPDPTDEVTIQLKGSRRNYTYTPTIEGNIANIDLGGYELADNYAVIVTIVKQDGKRLRSFRTDQFFIVESSDDLTQDDIIAGLEENVIYLNAQAFIAGADGRGIEGIQKTGTSGLVDTYTIYYTDNTTTTFQVTNGQQGEQGTSITSIEKTATVGLVDTYTITMSNGTTTTFEVTNGKDGVDLGLATIADDLTTDDPLQVLSARQGVVLKGMIDNIDFTLKSGTYAEALDAVLASNSVFEWLLVDEVDNSDLIKPLWHINGSLVDAAGAVVSLATLTAPVFSRDSGDVTPGTTLTIACPSGSTLNYSVNGVIATSTTNVTITINEVSVVKAYLKSGDAVSDIVAKSYGIAVDHKFQFKIKLTGDNSTEYVPVIRNNAPHYTMTVDWGDGSTPTTYNDETIALKECSHDYTGDTGDEFTITLRGSAIPVLAFSEPLACNVGALVAILDNSLECETAFSVFYGCTNLEFLSANALQNNTATSMNFRGCTALTAFEDGFFSNIKNITDCSHMFRSMSATITASQMLEIKSMIKDCTNFYYMFYAFSGTAAIPDTFFDEVAAGSVTTVQNFTNVASTVTGDAYALYSVLSSKVTQSAATGGCFKGGGFTNKDQVPSGWK